MEFRIPGRHSGRHGGRRYSHPDQGIVDDTSTLLVLQKLLLFRLGGMDDDTDGRQTLVGGKKYREFWFSLFD